MLLNIVEVVAGGTRGWTIDRNIIFGTFGDYLAKSCIRCGELPKNNYKTYEDSLFIMKNGRYIVRWCVSENSQNTHTFLRKFSVHKKFKRIQNK